MLNNKATDLADILKDFYTVAQLRDINKNKDINKDGNELKADYNRVKEALSYA